MKILITAGKSVEALRLFKHAKGNDVILADYGEMPHFPSKEYHFMSMGQLNADTVAHSLLTFCLDNAVEAILPVNDFEIRAVLESRILFEEFGIDMLNANETDIII